MGMGGRRLPSIVSDPTCRPYLPRVLPVTEPHCGVRPPPSAPFVDGSLVSFMNRASARVLRRIIIIIPCRATTRKTRATEIPTLARRRRRRYARCRVFTTPPSYYVRAVESSLPKGAFPTWSVGYQRRRVVVVVGLTAIAREQHPTRSTRLCAVPIRRRNRLSVFRDFSPTVHRPTDRRIKLCVRLRNFENRNRPTAVP